MSTKAQLLEKTIKISEQITLARKEEPRDMAKIHKLQSESYTSLIEYQNAKDDVGEKPQEKKESENKPEKKIKTNKDD